DEALLGDRRLLHPARAVLLEEAGGHLVGALEPADLLAHQVDALVARELLVERPPQRLAGGHFRHLRVSSRSPNGPATSMRENCSFEAGSPYTLVYRRSASGAGADAASRIASATSSLTSFLIRSTSSSSSRPAFFSFSAKRGIGSSSRAASISSRVR